MCDKDSFIMMHVFTGKRSATSSVSQSLISAHHSIVISNDVSKDERLALPPDGQVFTAATIQNACHACYSSVLCPLLKLMGNFRHLQHSSLCDVP